MEPRTPRQKQVAEMKALGLSDIAIAEELHVARATVRSLRTPAHMSRITGKGRGRPRKYAGDETCQEAE